MAELWYVEGEGGEELSETRRERRVATLADAQTGDEMGQAPKLRAFNIPNTFLESKPFRMDTKTISSNILVI